MRKQNMEKTRLDAHYYCGSCNERFELRYEFINQEPEIHEVEHCRLCGYESAFLSNVDWEPEDQ